MKILLLGKNGQVGWELQRSLAPIGDVIALDVDSPAPLVADFSRPESLAATVRRVQPDVIVNAAAHTKVDMAESEPERAWAVNATAPGVLAREAAASSAWLIHYSSDYVFDGSGDTPWGEDSPTGPLNTYGRSKVGGEEAIRASACRHVILRTSWVYGTLGANFASTILRLARESERLAVVDDQFGAPTGADLLADLTAHVVRSLSRHPELGGTYHAVAAGETSRHRYAQHVIDFARRAGVAVKVGPDAVEAVPSRARPTRAQRPANSRMATNKLRAAFGLVLPQWQHGIDRMLTEMLGR